MIPRTITLHNFLSYGNTPQTISFDEYHLICLSGKNGHGKSALLDAITWALWGQARKTVGTNKPDDGLLRLGSKQMMVMFEFDANGQRYRVRREYSKLRGKPDANLDIGIFDESLAEFRSLTEKTIRKTQAVIESVVGLDYETYVNSAFLRQGHANEFSQKSPKERKKILATILGVNRYDGLQSFALEKARECTQKIRVLHELQAQDEEVIATHDALVVQRSEYEVALKELEVQLKSLDKQRSHAQQAVEQYKARQKEHAVRQQELDEQTVALSQRSTTWLEQAQQWRIATKKLNALGSSQEVQKELAALRTREATMRKVQLAQVANQQELVTIEKQLLTRQREIEQLQQKEREVVVQKMHTAQAHFEQMRTQVVHAHTQYQQVVAELRGVTSQQQSLAAQKVVHQATVSKYEAAKKQFDKRRTFYGVYVPRAKWLFSQQEEMRTKGELVHDESSPSCPLCEQVLTAKRKQFLHDKMQVQQRRITHQYQRLHKVLGELKQRLVADHKQVTMYDAAAVQMQSIAGQEEQVAKRHSELMVQEKSHKVRFADIQKQEAAAQAQVGAARKACDEYEKMVRLNMEKDAELIALRSKAVALTKQQAEMAYDKQAHEQLEARIAALEKQRTDAEQLREKAGALREQRTALSGQRVQLKKERAVLAEKVAAFAKVGLDAKVEVQLHEALETVVKNEAEVRKQKDVVLGNVGTVKTKLEQVAQRQKVFAQRTKDIGVHEQAKADFLVLATAWSKNGIQALLIEQAIPEIEQEANELLGRLSQNQAQVFIESQRDLKSGGVRETLDIKISDTMGVRPYEMFSGGEAFRIDFALRIAISKLLARRAGTALQVLIIDEGFGSQDEEGLTRLMQSLYAVQEDFEKIIVVSHLPEFKENFPVHFVVNKGATGSTVSVEQRG